MRSGEPRKPPPGQLADCCHVPWRFAAPGPKASGEGRARPLDVPSYVPRPEKRGRGFARSGRGPAAPPADRMLPQGVNHAGR